MNKNEKALREFVRKEIINLLEAKDPATTSGMTKVKDTKNNTNPKKESKPFAKKVTKDGKPASVTATSEVKSDDAKIEDKKTTDSEKAKELRDKGYPKGASEKYECNDMGVKLEVNGLSLASVNSLYMIGIIRKSLEGRGQYVKEVKITMGDKEEKE